MLFAGFAFAAISEPDRVATLADLREILSASAPAITYGVAAFHPTPIYASAGYPFRERRPAPETVTSPLQIVAPLLDTVVLDAGPLQILGPGHAIRLRTRTVQ